MFDAAWFARFRFGRLTALLSAFAAFGLVASLGVSSAYAVAAPVPSITGLNSSTHPDASLWYSKRDASFSWDTTTSPLGFSYSVDHNATDLGLDSAPDVLQSDYAQGVANSLNGWFPADQAVADFNGDGISDVAVGSDNTRLSVLLGNGDGTFQPAKQTSYLASGNDIAAGDFNGDGKMDAVLSLSSTSNGFVILLGVGDGTFQAPTYASGGAFGDRKGIAAADFDGDGKLDVAYTDLRNSGTFTVCRGNGDGTFSAGVVYSLPTGTWGPWHITTGDVTGDGRPDVVCTDWTSSRVFLFTNDGSGGFASTYYALAVGGTPAGVAIADVDEDGKLDIVVGNRSFNPTEGITLLLNDGGGSFTHKAVAGNGDAQYSDVQVADMNGSGHMDLVGFDFRSHVGAGAIDVYKGDGTGNFSGPRRFPIGESIASVRLGVGDFNGDGLPDVMVGRNSDLSAVPMLSKPGAGVTGLADGTWYFHVRAVKSPLSGPVSDYGFRIDTTGPNVDMTGVTEGAVYLAEALPAASIVASDPNLPDASGLSSIHWSCSNGGSGESSASPIPVTVPDAFGTYMYTVYATDAAGNQGPTRYFWISVGLSSPKNVTFGPSSRSTATVRWAGCLGAQGYHIYLDGVLVGTTGVNVSAFTLKNLVGPSHVVEVEAFVDEETASARTRGVYEAVKAVQIGEIKFAPNSTKLTSQTKASLRKLAALAKAQGFTTVFVDGYSAHFDHGSKAFRAKLSRARANAVKNYLVIRFKAMKVKIKVVAIGQGAVPGSRQGHAPDRKAVISVK